MAYNPFSLKTKTILVTGASSGIGRAIAMECSKLGATVVITARNEERLKETLMKLEGEQPGYINADLSKDEDIKYLVDNCPQLDGLVNCAGFTKIKPFQFASKEDYKNGMETNFFGPTELTRLLVNSKKISFGASIVFISSISGVFTSYMGNSMYSASKSAINGLVKNIALELSLKKIRVNSVNPGMIETNILTEENITGEQMEEDMKRYPLKRYGKPEDVAFAAIYLLSDASSWITGSNILIDGGYTLQ